MQPSSGLGLASLLGTIQSLYPQARVTSGYRGPNDPLTRRNPRSMHALGAPDDPRAVDVAPIPGVNFNDYVASVKKAGVPVAQAFDEAAHPFPWTTGPNWHIASGGAQVAQPKRKPTLADIAAPSMGQMPVQLGVNEPVQSPMTLADLSLPQGDIPQKKPSKFTAGNILGVLGDALMAYGGLAPQFGPNLARQHELDQQQGFDREKLNAQLEMQRQKALEPPQFIQNLQAYMQMPDEAKRQYLSYLDATNPIAVSGPQGTQRVPRSLGPKPGTVEDGYVFLGGDPADQSNWRAQ